MNVVFLSPQFPPNYYQFCTALKAAGANVLAIGDSPYDSLSNELKGALTEYYYEPEMTNYDKLLRAIGYLTYRYGHIDRIDSNNEFWMGLEAQIRQDFNIDGQKTAAVDINRHKIGMKRVYQANNIPCADGGLATDADSIRAFAKKNGYPFILKPDLGVGAAATYKIHDEAELETIIPQLHEDYVFESCLTGNLVSFDGLVDRDGKIFFYTSHNFNNGIMEIVDGNMPMHYYNSREIPEKLREIGFATVKAFDIRERFFHCEFFENNGEYKAMEVNVRCPGGFTPDMMNWSCDFNIYQIWADMLVKGRSDLTYDRKYHVAHAARRYGFNYRYSHEELLAQLGGLCITHMEMPPAFSGAMGDYCYMIRTPDLATLHEAIAKVEECWD